MKKGFTLIELLAVIIILAILMVIAVPNVLNTLNKSRDEAFITQAQSIYKAAGQQYVVDSMSGTQKECYTLTDLGMNSNANLSAIVRINPNTGTVSSIRVADKAQKKYATGTTSIDGIAKQDWNDTYATNGVGTCASEVGGTPVNFGGSITNVYKPVTIKLMSGDTVIKQTTVTPNSSYVATFTITNVSKGTYKLVITASKHTSYTDKTYELNSTVTSFTTELAYGDVNGDGRVDVDDKNLIADAACYGANTTVNTECAYLDLDDSNTITVSDKNIVTNLKNYNKSNVVIE